MSCPKCGGTSGHEHVLVVHYTVVNMWGESAETTGYEWSPPPPKTVRCIDCGARVEFYAAQGRKRPGDPKVGKKEIDQ